ncbi:MAG TPA: MarC family protein [Longimicrobiaceae bacterium]|nr:MarC family protein [Longimicrobiaceae bacterium]
MSLASAALLMFFVMDPLGNIPLFLSALRHVDPSRQGRVIIRELVIALVLLVVFLFFGRLLFSLLHVSEPALTTAGGVILLLIALRMIFPSPERPLREEVMEEPFVVPLAVPYTAGPSALATEMLLMNQDPHRWPVWLGAILLAWAAASFILYFSRDFRRYLGDRGLTAVERLMGMLLVTVAMEMLLTGIQEFLLAH